MININEVKAIVSSIGGYDDNAVEKYLSVIKNAIACVESLLKEPSMCEDSRVIFLSGVRACRDISLINNKASGVTSFKIGDISITENGESEGSFTALYKSAMESCSELLSDNADDFAFIDV